MPKLPGRASAIQPRELSTRWLVEAWMPPLNYKREHVCHFCLERFMQWGEGETWLRLDGDYDNDVVPCCPSCSDKHKAMFDAADG